MLLALADHSDNEGVSWPSIVKLMAKTGESRATVYRAVNELKKKGLLQEVEGQWRLIMHPVSDCDDSSHSDNTPSQDETPIDREPSTEPSKEPDEVRHIFLYWVAANALDRARTKLTDGRRKKIKARLDDDYPVDDCMLAVYGNASSDYHQRRGEFADRDGPPYNSIELIFRNGEKLEEFREMGRQAAAGGSRGPGEGAGT
jgi:DNA-binding transcriptional MocR family regulator